MDELLHYLQSDSYEEYKLDQILNNKIIITKNHIKNIKLGHSGEEFDVIKLFEKYGHVFTHDDYILLVNENGYMLEYVPDDMKTNEIYKTAVQQNGYILEFVPEDKKTDEICETAVKQNGWALEYVPEDKKTDELCKIAVRQCVQALIFVPDNKKYLFIYS